MAKGLHRSLGSRGSLTRATRLWIDRSCSPLVMSRCNRRVTDTREETRGGKPRERLMETRAAASSIILKLCPKPQVQWRLRW